MFPTVFYLSDACGPLNLIEFIQRIALRALLFFCILRGCQREGTCIISSTIILQLLFLQDKLLFFFHHLVISSILESTCLNVAQHEAHCILCQKVKNVMYLSYKFEIKLGKAWPVVGKAKPVVGRLSLVRRSLSRECRIGKT